MKIKMIMVELRDAIPEDGEPVGTRFLVTRVGTDEPLWNKGQGRSYVDRQIMPADDFVSAFDYIWELIGMRMKAAVKKDSV